MLHAGRVSAAVLLLLLLLIQRRLIVSRITGAMYMAQSVQDA